MNDQEKRHDYQIFETTKSIDLIKIVSNEINTSNFNYWNSVRWL
jgi:hypothetical protein